MSKRRNTLLPPPEASGGASLASDLSTGAACRDLEGDLFFEEMNEREAKSVCRHCPVRRKCLNHALAHEKYGVWGGLSALDRQRLLGGLDPVTPEQRQAADEIRAELDAGVSQAIVAARLGVTVKTVSRWWLDPRQPRFHDVA